MQIQRSNEDFSIAETQEMLRQLKVAVVAMLESVSRLCRPGATTIFDYFQRYYLDVLQKIDGHDLSTSLGIAAAERQTIEIRKVSAACLECMRASQSVNTRGRRTSLQIEQSEFSVEARSQWLH